MVTTLYKKIYNLIHDIDYIYKQTNVIILDRKNR